MEHIIILITFIEIILRQLNAIKGQIWSETSKRNLWLLLDNCKVQNSVINGYGLKKACLNGTKRCYD